MTATFLTPDAELARLVEAGDPDARDEQFMRYARARKGCHLEVDYSGFEHVLADEMASKEADELKARLATVRGEIEILEHELSALRSAEDDLEKQLGSRR